MDANAIQQHLLTTAKALRPVGKPFVSVLKVAHELGATVTLRLTATRTDATAQIDLGNRPPNIILYRLSNVDGEREVRASEESLLTPRERFSIAHELGHWIIYSQLKIGVQSDNRAYWTQEQAINAFAGFLLVPDWLVSRWLNDVPEGVPVPPFALKHWANAQCRCSEEVVAKALVRGRRSLGFLRLMYTTRAKDRGQVLKVLCSASGEAVSLPAMHSYVDEPRLVELLEKTVGEAQIRDLRLGRCRPQNVRIAWRRGKAFRSEDTIWMSIALAGDAEPSALQLPIELG